MTETVIHIDGSLPLAVLDQRGWMKGAWEVPDGPVCAHQAIRLCAPVPGDAYLVEQVAARKGRGTEWNDTPSTTEADVRAWLGAGINVTDDDLAETFGPQWRAVVSLVRQAATITADQAQALGAAWYAAQEAAQEAAWYAAWGAAQDAARGAVTWNLATADGPYTHEHRDLLIGPWRSVFGLPEGLEDVL